MALVLPIKKQVSLHWAGRRIDLDVAQDLFSSHQVDHGSRMLLSSLESVEMRDAGEAVDFGCGYGVLGIAWQATHPAWSMRYVDRDALAVAFAHHNVIRAIPTLAHRAAFSHDVAPPEPPVAGFDLVLWNVPGKAGEAVLARLTASVLDGLGDDGLLALVVVNPLAQTLRSVGSERHDVRFERDETGRAHTVFHVRKSTPNVSWRHAFNEGAFDRADAQFSLGLQSWELTPVTGLREYDSLSHTTMLAGEAMGDFTSYGPSTTWLIHEPGVGHLAVLAGQLWPNGSGHLSSRDALALLTSGRSVARQRSGAVTQRHPAWGVEDLLNRGVEAGVAVIAVPDQAQPEELQLLMDAVASCVPPGGVAIMHGGSTPISRLERLSGKDSRWRAGKRTRRLGSAAIPMFRRKLP